MSACKRIAEVLGFPPDSGTDDDHLDSFVAHRLGELFVLGKAHWLGSASTGGYVMPDCAATTELVNELARAVRSPERARSRLHEELSAECGQRLGTLSCAALASPDTDLRQRLEAFVIQAHRDDAVLDAQTFDDWLKAKGWPEDRQREIVRDYEFGRALLWRYDEERGA